MSLSSAGWWFLPVSLLAVIVFAGGCDVPTGEPSLNTETDVSTPLVSEKAFSFLGGPESEFDPLIDTTSSEFDSLFTVGDNPKDISLVQEIDDFDIGALDGALDNAAGDLAFNSRNFGETFIDLSRYTPPSFSNKEIGNIVPDPEENLRISTTGTIDVSGSGRVAFDPFNDDYVELGNTRVVVQDLTIRPNADERVFDSLKYVYPDVRLEPYNPEDSLVVEFVRDPCGEGPCGDDGEFQRDITTLESGFDIPLQDARIYPDKPKVTESGEATFTIRGGVNQKLEVDDDDVVSLEISTSIEDFEIQELAVSRAEPFAVEVTPDADDSGGIDVADKDEARVAAFDGFEGITGRVDGLELANVNLNFSVTTKNLASTDAQLFSAIQGRNGNDRLFLAGASGTKRGVSSSDLDRFSTDFVENGSPIGAGSLIQLGVNLTDVSLGETRTPDPLTIDGSNANADDFVNALPSEVRLASQAELNTDGGDLRIRKPIELDAGFTLDVPLQLRGTFTVRDTVDADFSDLQDLADPEQDVSVSTAELQIRYTNRLPLGVDMKMIVVDDAGSTVKTFNENFNDDRFQIKPAPKNDAGAAAGAAMGEFVFTLGETQEDLQTLADGREIQLVLNMTQASTTTAARLRADDTLTFNKIRLNASTSIQSGN